MLLFHSLSPFHSFRISAHKKGAYDFVQFVTSFRNFVCLFSFCSVEEDEKNIFNLNK